MEKKKLTTIMALSFVGLYMVLILYALFVLLHFEILANFATALIFEAVGFILILYFVLTNIINKPLKTGYFVPLIILTAIYTLVLDAINFKYAINMRHELFIFINLIWLFLYCLISIPMYLMGRK